MDANSIPDPQDPSDDDFNLIGGEIFANFSPWASWLGDGNPFAPTAMPSLVAQDGTAVTQGDPDSYVGVTSGGITINLIFDAAALAAPASFRTGIQQAVAILAAAISDKITVNLKIHYGGTGGGAAAGPDHGLFQSYSSIRADLINNATPGDTTFNALTAGSSIQGQSNVVVWNAQLKLWGLMAANDTTTDDGSATFATDINPNLLVGVALHELTHAMGRVPYGPQPDIFDLFRFTGPGARLFQGGATAPAAYFSLDGGNTKLADYGRTSDASDFLNSGVQGPNDPFNEFYTGSTSQQLTAADLRQLDALGFHLMVPGSNPNHAPVMSIVSANVPAKAGQSLQATSLFSATDADNDALAYNLYDNTPAANSGHFAVNGAVVPANTVYTISAAQLAQVTFVAGAAGASDDLIVWASDNKVVSNMGEFHVNVAVNHAPVVSATDISALAGQSLFGVSLFSATDADNDTLSYGLYDNTPAANSGHFTFNGEVIPANSPFTVSAMLLGLTTFVAGAAGTSDDLIVWASDGKVVSNMSEFHVDVPANHAPVVSARDMVASAGQSLQASGLFTATDADNDTLIYYFYDNTPAANSGHFAVNGTVVPANTPWAVNAAQLAQATYVAGAFGTVEDLIVWASDGKAVSSLSEFHVYTLPGVAPATMPSIDLNAPPSNTGFGVNGISPDGSDVIHLTGDVLHGTHLADYFLF
jgi:hypothetical protein